MLMLISWAEVAAIAICVVASTDVSDVRCSVIVTVKDSIGSVCIVGGDVGASVGCAEGRGVGAPATYVGEVEGAEVGAAVEGACVGAKLGNTVGIEDGRFEGSGVGDPGIYVGGADGISDGCADGRAVGARVSTD